MAATADLRERFGVSASDAESGRLLWPELRDLLKALLRDPSSRLCAEVNGWPGPMDSLWLSKALLDVAAAATKAKVRWPWDVPKKAAEADVAAAQQSLRERWG